MAYIRTHETTQKRKGKVVKRYEVVWREVHPIEPGKTRARQESYGTRDQAEARRDALNNAKHTVGGTTALADAKAAGALTFGYYASAWLAAQRVKAATNDKLRPETVDGYERRLAVYALPTFGGRPIGSITSTDCETYLAALVGRGMSPATLKHHWSVLRNVFVYAHRNNALASNPVDAVDYSGNSAARRNKRHHPLTAGEVAAVAASIGERYPVYELFTYFAAYTGLRAEELAGCEIRDLEFGSGIGDVTAVVHVRRAKKRHAGECIEDEDGRKKRLPGTWVEAPLKSEKSTRTVPLPSWLAERLAEYLKSLHKRADEPTAPLWPNREMGGSRRRGCRATAKLDYAEPIDPGAFYKNLFRPALESVGLPASRPATADAPAVQGVRFHDLRHTAATLWLSNGVHFMQVSKWLGHSTFTLTLDVYGDFVPATDGGVTNPLPEPTAPAKPAPLPSNVVNLFRRQAN